jgi:hypothetical protein
MKKIYQFIFIAVNSLAVNTFAQTNACNELFISEIVYAKDNLSITGNSPLANSYAIELFNPKGTEVNLSDYSIKMYSTGGNETIIPLSGNITSKGTFVLGFTLSDEAIIQIAEMLSTSLDFTRQNSLELWGPNGLIDRVGDINISEADAINIAAAIADPVNYLNTLNLNLGSLTNLVARRKTTVVEGDPNFVQPSTNWTIAPNGDVSNLGTFQNVCMENVVYRLQYYCIEYNVNEGQDVTILVYADGISNHQIEHSVKLRVKNDVDCLQNYSYGNAELSDGGLTSSTDNANAAARTIQFTNPQALNSYSPSLQYYYAVVDGVDPNIVAEKIGLMLENPVNGTIDENNKTAAIIINESPQGIFGLESGDSNIKLFPIPFKDYIIIDNENNLNFNSIEVLNILGEVVSIIDTKAKQVNLEYLAEGIYNFKFTTSDNILFKKVIKQN